MLIALLKAVIAFVVVQMLLLVLGTAAGADLGIVEVWIATGVAAIVAALVFRRSQRRIPAGT